MIEHKIFKFDEALFNVLSDADKLKRQNAFLTELMQRRNFYVEIKEKITDPQAKATLEQMLSGIDGAFNTIRRELKKLNAENNTSSLAQHIKMANEIFSPIENSLVDTFFPSYSSQIPDSVLQEITNEFKARADALIESTKGGIVAAKEEMLDTIQSGINSVLNLKQELQLTGSFAERIAKEVVKSPEKARKTFFWFICTVLTLLVGLVGSFFVPGLKGLEWYASLAVRASIALPLFWIAQVLYSDYRYYRVAEMKYDHLDRLLGGGASAIAQLLQDDKEAKAATFRRLSELFLEIQDLTGIVSSDKSSSPVSLKEITGFLKEAKSMVEKPDK